MNVVSFAIDKDVRPRWGALLEGGRVRDLGAACLANGLEAPADHLAYFDMDGPYLPKARESAAIWAGDASLVRVPGAYRLPPGVGFARKPSVYLKAGDVAEVEIEGLGVLRNPVLP